MKSKWPLLVQVFRYECSLASLKLYEWDVLIRQARRSKLLGKLYYLAEEQRALNALPIAVFRHLESERVYAEKQFRDFLWEAGKLKKAFAGTGQRLIFLKGGAYAIAQLPPHRGRLFSDIDLLVPVNVIDGIERRLMVHGWLGEKLDAYDQQYYRRWMHEIPPMRHIKRGSVIDLHHNILPRTASVCPDAHLLLEAAVKSEVDPEVMVLSPSDRVIHSATHLFYDGELEHGFRDLLDLYELLSVMDADARLALVDRAKQLGLQKPVYYALRYLQLILNMSELQLPMQKMVDSGFCVRGIKFMDALFCRALLPDHASCNDRWTSLARWLLYVRSHWLRMPWYLLLPHLVRKALLRFSGRQQH